MDEDDNVVLGIRRGGFKEYKWVGSVSSDLSCETA
jgi:hypothetical protein